MDVIDASYYIQTMKKTKIKVAKWGKPKIYEYQSASHEFKPEQWVLLKENQNQWGGPFQIVKLKLHNTVEIKPTQKNQKIKKKYNL
jgi:hypothetical protein